MTSEHRDPLAPVGLLPPQPWMTAPETRAVIEALRADGAEVRFVGGCVRDAVLRRPIKDIDIATHDPPETVLALLQRAGIRAIPTGIEHGTVTAVVGREHFEITTLRCDVESYGRHARVQFTDDWAADAARRDLTMNALFCDPDGNIYDPFDGLSDLGHGRVRFVGEPRQRIEEDVLRLLRFFRFYAHYGYPPADIKALAACRAMADRLPSLSGERVCGELVKLLLAPDPASVLVLMQGEKVLPWVLPEAAEFGRLRVLCWLETKAIVVPSVRPEVIRRLATVLRTDAAGAQAVGERLRLSNRQTQHLVALCAPQAQVDLNLDGPARRRALRRLGADVFRDLVLINWAGRKAVVGKTLHTETEAWLALLAEADNWTPVDLPIKGRDLLDLGLPPGPHIGSLLAQVEAWWEAGDYRATREDCLAHARALAG